MSLFRIRYSLFLLAYLLLNSSFTHAQVSKDSLVNYYYNQYFDIEATDFDAGFDFLKKMDARALKIGDKEGHMEAQHEMGVLLNRNGRYLEANKAYIEAIKTATSLKMRERVMQYLLMQTDVYFNLDKFDRVAANLAEVKPLILPTDTFFKLKYLNATGELYERTNKLEEARKTYFEALAINKLLKNKNIGAQLAYNLGNVCWHLGKCDEAIKFGQEVYKQDSLSGDISNALSGLIFLAEVHAECLNDPKTALVYLNRFEETKKKYKLSKRMDIIYDLYHVVYAKLGDYKKSVQYLEKSVVVEDSIYTLEREEAFKELEEQYAVEKKQAEIENLKARAKDQHAILTAEKKNKNLAYGGLVLAALMVCGTGYGYYNSKRYNQLLSEREKHKEILLQEVHHRIGNSLQLITSLMNIQGRATKNAELKDFLNQTEMRVHAMAAMHELLNQSTSPVNIDIKEYLDNVLDFHHHVLNQRKELKLTVSIDEAILPSKKALPLALMVNELVTNSLKYAFPNHQSGQIWVTLRQESPNNWLFRVADNGIGLPKEYHEMLQNNLGLGCQLVNIMVDQIDGILTTSNAGGASFEVRFVV